MAEISKIDLILNQAVAAHGQGRLAEARAGYEKVLKKAPKHVEALKRLALIQLQSGEAEKGFETIRKANKLKPKSKSVLEILAVAAIATKNFAVAVQCFEVLAKVKPVNPLIFSEWSKAEYELGNLKRSIARFQDFLERIPQAAPEHCFTLGRLYFRNRQPLEAAAWLDKALEAGFRNSELLAIRANCLIHEGREDAAVKMFEEALALDPDNIEAHYQHRALIETRAGDPIFAHLENLKSRPGVTGTPEINLYFLLGNLYQKTGDFERAFQNYAEANQKTTELYAKDGVRYDAAEVSEEFSRLTTAFSGEGIDYEGSDSELPVFIVGMPRSGTTLLEQIITSHPKAEGRGELDTMHYIHVEMEEALKTGEAVADILKKHGKEWQERYLEALAPGAGTLRVTDKLPANYRSLGLISKLFPKAKIIHIRRNPFDTCVSIFCNLFDTGHPYSTALETIGDYYRQVEALIETWKKQQPMPIFEVVYEDLVADQETVSKAVIDFLGLDWDPACLEFHKKDEAAMTLSSIQVRRPMTTSSVARWKRFEKHLAPLEKALGPELTGKAKNSTKA